MKWQWSGGTGSQGCPSYDRPHGVAWEALVALCVSSSSSPGVLVRRRAGPGGMGTGAPPGTSGTTRIGDGDGDAVAQGVGVCDVAVEGDTLCDAPVEGVALCDVTVEGVALCDAPVEGEVVADEPPDGLADATLAEAEGVADESAARDGDAEEAAAEVAELGGGESDADGDAEEVGVGLGTEATCTAEMPVRLSNERDSETSHISRARAPLLAACISLPLYNDAAPSACNSGG